jgi:hypothetical protein
MAQTTQNTSFGLVLAAAAHPNPRRAVKTQIEPKNMSQYKKKTAKKKRKPSFGADLIIATHDPLSEGNPHPRLVFASEEGGGGGSCE